MVAGDDDDGVLQFTRLLEQRERLRDVAVEALDLEVVVRDVGADLLDVREESRHRHALKVHAAGPARSPLVSAVRIPSAEPEAEWLP